MAPGGRPAPCRVSDGIFVESRIIMDVARLLGQLDDLHTRRADFHMATGAVEHDGFLYLEGPQRDALLEIQLEDS